MRYGVLGTGSVGMLHYTEMPGTFSESALNTTGNIYRVSDK